GLELRGGYDRLRHRLPTLVAARLPYNLTVRVVHQLAHRDRWDWHRDHIFAPRCGDISGACEPRADVRHLIVEDHHDLEVGGLRTGRAGRRPGRLNRTVADLRDVTFEAFVGQGVDSDLGALADGYMRDVGLIDFDLGLDDRHVSELEQHCPRIVHGADHHH